MASDTLTRADLTEAVFDDCRIEDVQFSNTILNGARFTNCRIARCRAAHAGDVSLRFRQEIAVSDAGPCGLDLRH